MPQDTFTISGPEGIAEEIKDMARSRGRSRSAEILRLVEPHLIRWREKLHSGARMPKKKGTK